MAPKVSSLKEEYEKDFNFVFLNVDNQKWDNYIRKFDVNGIPQVNLFDKKGNLRSTFIGKQEEFTIRDSIDQIEKEAKSHEEIINNEEHALATYELVINRYESGVSDLITVLNLQQQWINSKSKKINIEYQKINNRLNLLLALGGDFNSE